MAKIGWIKPTLLVEIITVGETERLSLTSKWLYENRHKYNYVFAEQTDASGDEYLYKVQTTYDFVTYPDDGINTGIMINGTVFDDNGVYQPDSDFS